MTRKRKAVLILYIIIASTALALGILLFLGPALSPHTFTGSHPAKKAAYYGVATVLTVTGYVSICSNRKRLKDHRDSKTPEKFH